MERADTLHAQPEDEVSLHHDVRHEEGPHGQLQDKEPADS